MFKQVMTIIMKPSTIINMASYSNGITITMVNFRLFENATFSFSDKLVLIAGSSGRGKTSILMAMNFAVTGEGKKITMHGKKSCKVIMEIENLKITRTKGPCRLTVVVGGSGGNNQSYEDNEAQSIIDSTLPTWDAGYVPQKLYKSFLMMTPADKLKYIQRIIFSFDGDKSGESVMEKVHKNCKNILADRTTRQLRAKTERETTEKILSAMNMTTYNDDTDDRYRKEYENKSLDELKVVGQSICDLIVRQQYEANSAEYKNSYQNKTARRIEQTTIAII